MVFNAAQFHLLVNHVPVIGMFGMVLALLVAIQTKSRDIKRLVLLATTVVGLSALAPFWTGEPAEELIEDRAGIDKAMIHEHEEAAEFATILAVVTGIAAGAAWFWQRQRPDSLRRTLPGVFVLATVTAVAMGKTAHEGGKISHPEIRDAAATQSTRDAKLDD